MEVLDRIIKKINTTSQTSKIKYFCSNCEDTGWILTDNSTYKKCPCQEQKHLQTLWENFGINPKDVRKINEYKVYDTKTERARDRSIDYIMQFPKMFKEKVKENSLALLGQPGAGKTHLVIAIGASLLKQGYKVVYMPYLEASRQLKTSTNDEEYYNKLSNRYKKCDLLIIDDLFKEKIRNGQLIPGTCITEPDMKHIYPILNYRYVNNLPMLISAELTPNVLIELDDALASRVLEISNPFLTVFDKQEYNYRMRKFRK